MSYDPALHHPPSPGFRRTGRRSIRLKGHDYAGGGVYFVTLCAHREAGDIFANEAAKRVAEECWQKIPEHFPQAEAGEFVVMPDHVHGIIRMAAGAVGAKNLSPVLSPADPPDQCRPHGTSRTLGSVIRGFKIGVGKGIAAPRIWHRNYYEMIVRSEEAERQIAEYIRMNPWRCVQELGGGLRGIGNPALWNGEKLGVLCSREIGAKDFSPVPEAGVYFGGWHSPKEKEILEWLLKSGRRVIACPAWGIEDCGFAPGVRNALEENRMLILEMRDVSGNLAAAEARNRFVIEHADALFTPHIARGGMLERLLNELSKEQHKCCFMFRPSD
jgi:REP element-mobilizing transposase RayT